MTDGCDGCDESDGAKDAISRCPAVASSLPSLCSALAHARASAFELCAEL
ncbi:MAG TPA: hypothetical protein PKY59_24545 [Pyrinomonadaceae bacterium]|nr:hypothetical protein [Pyrinomonadaceae bacterium]